MDNNFKYPIINRVDNYTLSIDPYAIKIDYYVQPHEKLNKSAAEIRTLEIKEYHRRMEQIRAEERRLKYQREEQQRAKQMIPEEINAPVQREDHEENETECIICMDARRNVVVLPCKHLMFCSLCTNKSSIGKPCPYCRTMIESVLNVFT